MLESLVHNDQFKMTSLSDAYQKGELSPVDVLEYLFKRIEIKDKLLNSFITVCYESALKQAAKAADDIAKGLMKSPLHGIPIAVKDLIYTKDTLTSMGSGAYQSFIPTYDAQVITQLKNAGAIIIGKTNTHELAYGPTGDYSFYGSTRNPYDISKMSGGSSSGSAVAVATSLALGALGTDTGGSVRIPAAFCGIVGMKPTFGSVSKHGVHPLSFTMDHIGPMTKSVRENAILLNYMVGKDTKDPYSIDRKKEDYTARLGNSVKGFVVGIPLDYIEKQTDVEIIEHIFELIDALKFVGVHVKIIDLPHIEELIKVSGVTAHSEVYAHSQDLVHDQNILIGELTRERMLQGSTYKAYEYVNAQQAKHSFVNEFEKIFQDVDFIVMPTVPILPQDIGSKVVNIKGNEELINSLITNYTLPFSYLGLPSLALPWGTSSENLPIGMQIIGRNFDESRLYQVGYALER